MSTAKQIQASRANGAKSKGPVTAQGKRNSSRNSICHGLLAETIVLEAEKEDAFLELLEELFEEHQPQTPTEAMLVDIIAAASWRQQRIWGMQKVAFDYDVATSTSATNSNPLRAVMALRDSPDNARTHELMLRYEIAFDRQISRALLRLQQLQERREKATALANSTAVEPISSPPPPPEPAENTSAERTQQLIEKVTQPLTAPVDVPQSHTLQGQPPTPNPKSSTKAPGDLLTATRDTVRPRRKKPAA